MQAKNATGTDDLKVILFQVGPEGKPMLIQAKQEAPPKGVRDTHGETQTATLRGGRRYFVALTLDV